MGDNYGKLSFKKKEEPDNDNETHAGRKAIA
jgi:hypothetical protein